MSAVQGQDQAGPPPASPEALYRDLPRKPDAVPGLWLHQGDLLGVWADQAAEDSGSAALRATLPVKHASRVRGPDQSAGPGNDLAARFGRGAAHAEWFYGFRLAIKTDLGSRIVRAWSIVPAAVNEREIAIDLLAAGPAPRDLLAGKGFNGAGPPLRPHVLGPAGPHRSTIAAHTLLLVLLADPARA